MGASRSTSHLVIIEMEATQQVDEQANKEFQEAMVKLLPADASKELKKEY